MEANERKEIEELLNMMELTEKVSVEEVNDLFVHAQSDSGSMWNFLKEVEDLVVKLSELVTIRQGDYKMSLIETIVRDKEKKKKNN